MNEGTNRKQQTIRLAVSGLVLLIIPALLMSLAGNWGWLEGWAFSLWYIAMSYTVVFYQFFKNPALLEERRSGQRATNRPVWDKRVGLVAGFGFFAWLVMMPLESQRYGWTGGFPDWLKIIGLVGLIPSFYLILQTYIVNAYLSRVVRVQEDRGQRVVTTGVYGIVRHPMYLGASLFFICGPLLMESIFGVGLGLFMTLVLAYRITREEALLVEDLEGYAEYKGKTKFRLIPGIW